MTKDKDCLESTLDFLKESMLNLISYRLRSKEELKQRYLNKGYNLSDIEYAIDYLESKGYIDDEEFSRMYATHLIKFKSLGKKLVLHKFKTHRIEMEILMPIIESVYLKNPPNNLIKAIIKRKFRNSKNKKNSKAEIYNYLKRKGFTWEDISCELNNF